MSKTIPHLFEDTDLLSKRLGLALAAVVPLVAVALSQYVQDREKAHSPVPLAAERATHEEARLIEFCAKNLKPNRAFVLFHHGTCVLIEGLSQPEEIKKQALTILKETASPDTRFICTPVDDRDLIISYTEPVFHLRFGEDIELHRQEIEEDFRRFLTEKELAEITPTWEPPFHAKVGLRSRARLLKDAENPVISHIIAPRSIEKASAKETASVSF